MYSNIQSVNILTVLLREHGVRHAVVCPGSRNAPISHNLVTCEGIECYAATDERSAGFEALGLSVASGEPVAVCVTSGSALLNVMPAVCEAWYQKVPLVVVSADRPSAWIGQLDGQTMEQVGAMNRWCCCSVNLPEISGGETEHAPSVHNIYLQELEWNCNWLVNRALVEARRCMRPVHINVPISEPLYDFTVEELPEERVVRRASVEELVKRFSEVERVMIVVGQTRQRIEFGELADKVMIVAEPLANCDCVSAGVDDWMMDMQEPEMVIYLGGTLVGKSVKRFLREAKGAEQWFVSGDGEYADTFMNLKYIVFEDVREVVGRLRETSVGRETEHAPSVHNRYGGETHGSASLQDVEEKCVEVLERMARGRRVNFVYANSMAVRYACRYATHYIYCNRGVNGIEGCVSTAVGIARAKAEELCVCVTGDLSFLYDGNALWRNELPHNLRVVVLNNGGGKIFRRFEGLRESKAREVVMGRHEVSCRGMCEGFGVEYRRVNEDVEEGVKWLLEGENVRLLEIKQEYENLE